MMKGKGFGRKPSWANQISDKIFAWREGGKSMKHLVSYPMRTTDLSPEVKD
jgi:hypothetical protein